MGVFCCLYASNDLTYCLCIWFLRYSKSLKLLPANCLISFAVRDALPKIMICLPISCKCFKTGRKSPSPDNINARSKLLLSFIK